MRMWLGWTGWARVVPVEKGLGNSELPTLLPLPGRLCHASPSTYFFSQELPNAPRGSSRSSRLMKSGRRS
jgi:hypothetical protein